MSQRTRRPNLEDRQILGSSVRSIDRRAGRRRRGSSGTGSFVDIAARSVEGGHGGLVSVDVGEGDGGKVPATSNEEVAGSVA